MRHLKSKDVEVLCYKAGIALTTKQKKERKIYFCTGCLFHANHGKFQNSFVSFAEDLDNSMLMDDISQTQTIPTYPSQVIDANIQLDRIPEGPVNVSTFTIENQAQTSNVIIDVDCPNLDLCTLTSIQRQKLAYELGRTERKSMDKLASTNSQSYKNVAFFKDFNLEEYSKDHNAVVKSFLNGLRSCSSDIHEYRAVRTMETKWGCRHLGKRLLPSMVMI